MTTTLDDLAALPERIAALEAEVQALRSQLAAPALLGIADAAPRLGLTPRQLRERVERRADNGLLECGAVVEGPLRVDVERWVEWERGRVGVRVEPRRRLPTRPRRVSLAHSAQRPQRGRG